MSGKGVRVGAADDRGGSGCYVSLLVIIEVLCCGLEWTAECRSQRSASTEGQKVACSLDVRAGEGEPAIPTQKQGCHRLFEVLGRVRAGWLTGECGEMF